jgi:hypothetical protein
METGTEQHRGFHFIYNLHSKMRMVLWQWRSIVWQMRGPMNRNRKIFGEIARMRMCKGDENLLFIEINVKIRK